MSDAPPGPSPGQLADAVAAVWERFREPTLARVKAVEDAALAVLEGGLSAEARRAAEREAHRLAGSVGTFGFAEGSRLAREAEALLAGDAPLEAADALRLTDLAVALRDVLAAPRPAPAPAPTPPPGAQPPAADAPRRPPLDAGTGAAPLLAVGLDDDLWERLAPAAAARGIPLARAAPGDALPALRAAPARAVLVALGGDDPAGRLARLAELAAGPPRVPVLAVAAEATQAERLDALRRGARGYLRLPAAPEEVLDAVERAAAGDRVAAASVLAVDDDPSCLEAVRGVLEPAGLAVHTRGDPAGFWEALESLRPDAVVLDVDMPHVSGTELCGTVRADPRWHALPFLVLTARTDADTLRRVFEAGADDYVPKPFAGPELLRRVAGRLERARTDRAGADADPVTGLASRRRGAGAVDQLLRVAAGEGQPLSVALLEVEGLPALNARAGREAGDRALRRAGRLLQGRTRAQDVVARWDGERFLAALYGMEKEDAAELLEGVLGALAGGEEGAPLRASAGVAQFPADGADGDALAAAAARALGRAVEAGGGRAVPAGWTPGDPARAEAVDVLVVEDDEAVARLLAHALGTRGWTTRWVRDGREAADLLTGARAALRARAVLLDVDLPGLDGLGVLRLLRRDGVLERTRVIVLTVRAHEAEVLQALELGAFDHVPKPFSLPVLLHRVRRALPG